MKKCEKMQNEKWGTDHVFIKLNDERKTWSVPYFSTFFAIFLAALKCKRLDFP